MQQPPPPERRFCKISCEDRILQCSVDQIVPEMVEQLEEVPKMVSQGGIQRRIVQQIVGFLRNLQRAAEQDLEEIEKTMNERVYRSALSKYPCSRRVSRKPREYLSGAEGEPRKSKLRLRGGFLSGPRLASAAYSGAGFCRGRQNYLS